MANYSLVVDSTFQPFSFERYIQPYQIYGQEYKAQEEAISELATRANVWENMINPETEREAYAMYNTYAKDLEEQAVQLAKEGLTPASRQSALKMKQRYSSEIVPIEQAFNRRKQLAEEQRQLLIKDPTLRFEKTASQMSLNDFIKNPEADYGSSFSGNLLRDAVGEAAANLTKQIKENPRVWKPILRKQYYETVVQRGFTSEDILKAIQDPNAFPELTKIVDDVMKSSGVLSWADEATKKEFYGFARQGLWKAVGDPQYQTLSNKSYNNNPQDKDPNNIPATRLYYRAVPKTTVDVDKKTTQMNEDLAFLQELLSNPSLINKTDKKNTLPYVGPGLIAYTQKEKVSYPYQEKLKELSNRYNLNYTITDGVLSESNLADVAQQISNDIKSSAVRSFSYKPNITQSDLITQVLKENTRSYYRRSNNTGLYELEDNEKGKQIDIKNLNSYFTSDSDIDFDPDLGFIINATDSDGETRSAVIDTELLDDPNRTFSKAQQSIKVALDNGEDELATLLIEATMKAFYDRFNTLEKRQSNTTSK